MYINPSIYQSIYLIMLYIILNIYVFVFKQRRPYHFKFFKGCLPQILLGPFLNTLTHITCKVSLICHFWISNLKPKSYPLPLQTGIIKRRETHTQLTPLYKLHKQVMRHQRSHRLRYIILSYSLFYYLKEHNIRKQYIYKKKTNLTYHFTTTITQIQT